MTSDGEEGAPPDVGEEDALFVGMGHFELSNRRPCGDKNVV
jgi:hypothetical protein